MLENVLILILMVDVTSKIITVGNTEPEDETEENHQGATPPGRAARPDPRLGGGRVPPGCPCLTSSPIRSPRYQSPKCPINLPRNSLGPPPPSSLDRGI